MSCSCALLWWTPVQCLALLESALSSSFVTEHLTQSLNLPRSPTKYENNVYCWSFSHYCFSSSHSACHLSDWLSHKVVFFDCTDTVLLHSISFSSSWTHLSDDTLAEPNLGIQRRLISYLASTFYAPNPASWPAAWTTWFTISIQDRICLGPSLWG